MFFAFTSLAFGDWVFEENEALASSSRHNMPILAVFLIEEGCCWSDNLKEEILQNPEFIDEASQEMILWQVLITSKKHISDKYQVQEYPFALLLDPEGVEFARIPLITFDYKRLKTLLSTIIDDFSSVCYLINTAFDEQEWQKIYKKASCLSVPYFKEKILKEGLKKEKGCFFHAERYADLLQKNGVRHPCVLKLKKKILRRDKSHRLGMLFQLASMEAWYQRSKNAPLEKMMRSLLEYLQKSVQLEPEYHWKAELLLSQFLLEKNQLEKAKAYLLLAYQHAPDSVKLDLQKTCSHESCPLADH